LFADDDRYKRPAHKLPIQEKEPDLINVIATTRAASASQSIEHFDVLIVGAGISGIGISCHLTTHLPHLRCPLGYRDAITHSA
jgi:NADH dehydrogenase FAD-containing subunit